MLISVVTDRPYIVQVSIATTDNTSDNQSSEAGMKITSALLEPSTFACIVSKTDANIRVNIALPGPCSSYSDNNRQINKVSVLRSPKVTGSFAKASIYLLIQRLHCVN